MTISFIVEGDSDKIIFESIKKQFRRNSVTFEIITTNGKPNMLKKARRHYSACKNIYDSDHVIFLPDLDNDPCPTKIKDNIYMSVNDDVKINVLIKELEAWILADQHCISTTLNVSYHSSGYTDEIIDPKGELFKIVRDCLGYNPTEVECANLFSKNFSIERSKKLNNSANRFYNLIEGLIPN